MARASVDARGCQRPWLGRALCSESTKLCIGHTIGHNYETCERKECWRAVTPTERVYISIRHPGRRLGAPSSSAPLRATDRRGDMDPALAACVQRERECVLRVILAAIRVWGRHLAALDDRPRHRPSMAPRDLDRRRVASPRCREHLTEPPRTCQIRHEPGATRRAAKVHTERCDRAHGVVALRHFAHLRWQGGARLGGVGAWPVHVGLSPGAGPRRRHRSAHSLQVVLG